MPMAVPRMPASASGVSMTRSSPKSFCRPSVTRKTPPSLPMSSPMMRTLGSDSIAARRPMLMPLPRLIFVISVLPFKRGGIGGVLRLLLDELRSLLDVRVLEEVRQRRVGHRQAALAQPGGDLVGLGL